VREPFFVSCTTGVKEQSRLWPALLRLGIGEYRFIENNRRGLPACYNEALAEFAGRDQILVFVHDDVTVADTFVREKLNQAMNAFNIVGLVGASCFSLNVPNDRYPWGVWPAEHRSGSVEHEIPQGAVWSSFGPTPRRCVILDGLFLAIDMLRIGNVRFDERFDFHLYDLDFCLTAHLAGLVLGTTNIYVNHASIGDFQAASYQQASQWFRQKWQGRI
jgi:GT2 family glycosyltransferase